MGTIKRHSFTLIELIIAVSIVALILPAVFAIFFSIIRQQLVLFSYQIMKQQGNTVEKNIRTLLKTRAAYVTDNTYSTTSSDALCPLLTTPTPPASSELFLKDIQNNSIHIFPTPLANSSIVIASASAVKDYRLSTSDVTILNLGFTCYRVNEYSPAIVTTSYIVQKTTRYNDVFLPYTFTVRLGNY